MKAVIYACYSSDSQCEESIERQLREYGAFADKRIRTAWDEEKGEWYFSSVDVATTEKLLRIIQSIPSDLPEFSGNSTSYTHASPFRYLISSPIRSNSRGIPLDTHPFPRSST